jgi:RNA polymerase sigma factor (sigma-70 family)
MVCQAGEEEWRMSSTNDQELFSMAARCFGAMQRRLLDVKLPSQEWEDIRSEAIIRVFEKRGQFDKDRGKLFSWVFTIVRNSVFNSLRRSLPARGVKSHRWRTNLLLARPIRTKVVQTSRWGEEITVVEPDIVDDQSWPPSDIEDFRNTLNRADRRVFDWRVRDGMSFYQIAARLGSTYQRAHLRFHRDVRRLWEAYESK